MFTFRSRVWRKLNHHDSFWSVVSFYRSPPPRRYTSTIDNPRLSVDELMSMDDPEGEHLVHEECNRKTIHLQQTEYHKVKVLPIRSDGIDLGDVVLEDIEWSNKTNHLGNEEDHKLEDVIGFLWSLCKKYMSIKNVGKIQTICIIF